MGVVASIGLLDKLEEAVKNGKETANTLRLEIDHDNDEFCISGKLDDLIMARKPSSTGASKGCVLNFSGVLRNVARGGKYFDIHVTVGRGGAGTWAGLDVKEAANPPAKAMAAGK